MLCFKIMWQRREQLHDGDYQRTLSSKKMQCMRGSGSQVQWGAGVGILCGDWRLGLAQCRDWLDRTKQKSDVQRRDGGVGMQLTDLPLFAKRHRASAAVRMLPDARVREALVCGGGRQSNGVGEGVAGGELAAHKTVLAAAGAGRVLLRCETARRDCKGDCNTSWERLQKAAALGTQDSGRCRCNA